MSAPRIEIDLGKIEANTRVLVDRLTRRGVGVTGVTKATLGSPGVGAAMLRGGASGLGDSRTENLARLQGTDGCNRPALTLIRSPMLSGVDHVVRNATCSLNTEAVVLRALDDAARAQGVTHSVVLMVELGDLREGIACEQVPDAIRFVLACHSLRLLGLGTNLACQNGIVPSTANMGVLSDLVVAAETRHGLVFERTSGGNSANLSWLMGAREVGRVNDLRLGEAILLGLDPTDRSRIPGLYTDAFRVSAEVIELTSKPQRPWGRRAQTAFGARDEGAPSAVAPEPGGATNRQAILAIGRQDIDPDGLLLPDGITLVGASSDHLLLNLGDHGSAVGDEISFGVGYGALLRAMTSPHVAHVEHLEVPAAPLG